MEIEKIVIDTNIFVNPETRSVFGDTPTKAFQEFLNIASRAKSIQFFMPPSILEELLNFVDSDKDKISPQVILNIIQKPPKKYELSVPAFLLYELMDEIRNRVNKGLRIAEKAVRKVENKEDINDVISSLRDNYRTALRDGIIDSKEDVDLILLAKELNACLVSSDKGVITWADKLGIRWIDARYLRQILETKIK